jgi:fatty acid/phospholipid biosynthesis enzyme
VVIIGHGRSNALAVKNAIKAGIQEVKYDLNEKIKHRIEEIYRNDQVKKLLESLS